MQERTDMIHRMREFNRFYTHVLGLLDRNILDSGFSLTEARILFELQEAGHCIANDLSAKLGIDKSYVSRILAGFEKKGLVCREVSRDDGRSHTIALTDKGRRIIAGSTKNPTAISASCCSGFPTGSAARYARRWKRSKRAFPRRMPRLSARIPARISRL